MSVQEGLVLSQPPIYDCFNDRPEIEPNCDIAGLGILVGFLAPAYLALIIITVHYLVAFDQNKNPDHGMVGSDQDCEMQRLRPSRVQSSNQPVTSPTNAVAELNSEESIQRRNEADCSSSSQPTSLGLREEMTIPQSDRDLPDHQTVCNYEAESDEEWSPNPIDQFILGSRLSRWLFPKRSSLKNPDPFARDMRKAFDNYILAFCDVAIVLAATFFLNLRYLQCWEKTSLAVIQMESGIPCQVSGRYWSPKNEAAAEFWPETRT
ncbi:hypothetical protein HYQ44_004789 [Verticillium longisporum]|nr:hypothetical protein HYQ44_004789 [Verticillium longisporum]